MNFEKIRCNYFLTWPNNEIRYTLCSESSWPHFKYTPVLHQIVFSCIIGLIGEL